MDKYIKILHKKYLSMLKDDVLSILLFSKNNELKMFVIYKNNKNIRTLKNWKIEKIELNYNSVHYSLNKKGIAKVLNTYRQEKSNENNKRIEMKKAAELRKETDKLEEKVKLSVIEFIEKVGNCDIQIDTEMHYIKSVTGERNLAGIIVSINVTV